MATSSDFKTLAEKRLKTVGILIENDEWVVAAYIMGFVLECILKSAACKVLNLPAYPEPGAGIRHEVSTYFLTHNFDQLLVVSGMTDLFKFSGNGSSAWSGFTQEYTGAWTDIRYKDATNQFDEQKVTALYAFLTGSEGGIITLVENEKRW
jgi:hypothetical protein